MILCKQLLIVFLLLSCGSGKFVPSETKCTLHDLYADCSFRGLQYIPDNLPKNITCLNMAGNDVSKINGEVWCQYRFLQKLSMANNSLENLDDTSFTCLENLQMLDLSLNKIQYNNVSKNAFKPLKTLVYLDLKQALPEVFSLERYPPSLMQIEELTTLWIDGLGQHPLPALPKLKNLHFSGQYGRCNISFLERKIFESVESVEQLFVSNCSIEMVESGILSSVPNISALDLSWNTNMGFDPIANITEGIANRTQFKRINLNNVYDYYDANCGVLTVENLGSLNASHLEFFAFEGNNIVRMNTDAVKCVPKTMKYISFRDNMLMFGEYFGELVKSGLLSNLVYYDSSQQFHNHIPLNVPNEVRVPLLVENKHTFDDSICMSDCENMFTSYYFKDYFQLIDEQLKRFNITPFRRERNSSPVMRIEYLDLSENLPGVIYVALKMFEQAPFIKFLNLSTNYNGIPYLGSQELFLNYSSLRYLDLSSNRIEDIQQDAFKKLKLLQELDLSNNKIANITFNLSHMSSLRYLNLQNNTFETILEETSREIDNLEFLKLNIENNNIQCRCDDLRFVDWIMKNRHKFERFENTKCKYEDKHWRYFGEVNLEHYKQTCRPPDYSVLVLCVSLALLAFIIIVSCGIVYRFKWNLRYLYHMTKIKLIGQYQLLEDREYEKDVFVSYANEDHSFITQNIIPELGEKGNFSLLIHERDFLAGEYVADNILKAITSTRKTLVVLTKAYIQSKWCMYELNMARMEAADTARNVLCIILKEDVPTKYLPVEIIDIIKKKTYLEFPADEENMEGFWERLRSTLLIEV